LAKQKFKQITTPAGIILWAHTKKEEEWKGVPTGKFSCQIKFRTPEETAAFQSMLEQEFEHLRKEMPEYFKDLKPKRGSLPTFGEKEDQNGDISFKATTKSTYKSNKTGEVFNKVVPVFDVKGKPLDAVIGNGSIGKLAISLAPKFKDNSCYGINLWLDAIQVMDLQEYSAGGAQEANAFGFGQEEGSCVAEDMQEAEVNPFTNEEEQPVEAEAAGVKDF